MLEPLWRHKTEFTIYSFMVQVTPEGRAVITQKRDSTVDYCEVAYMHLLQGFCDGNARATYRKYQHWYSDWMQRNRHVLATVHSSMKGTGAFIPPGHLDHPRCNVQNEEEVPNAARATPLTSTRRVAYETGLAQEFSFTYTPRGAVVSLYLQFVQGLQPGENNLRLHFCRWLLHRTADESDFSCHVLRTFKDWSR
jgi:hypothetical protein